MFNDSRRVLGVLGKKKPIMTTIEKLKVDKADESKNLIVQGWSRTKPVGGRLLITNIVTRVSYVNYEI